MRIISLLVMWHALICLSAASDSWKQYVGKPGPTGWRCHIIQPDPHDDGPDGINIHDWDGDGAVDLFVNYEEGQYSRLFFNPGKESVCKFWPDYVEFQHGKCEDSGIGDLDGDGDIDYVANGGWVYFNPGKGNVRDASKWTMMRLFDHEQRVPTVFDVNGDGLNDLIVGAQEWYMQPKENKHHAENWNRYTIGENRWPMNCIMSDVNGDGRTDIVVPDRGVETCWYENPGEHKVTSQWKRKTLHPHSEPMFMAVEDINGDGIDDFIIAGGKKGAAAKKLIVLLRTNKKGDPTYREILINQPSGNFPKGVVLLDLDNNPEKKEVLIIPKQGDVWMTTYTGNPMETQNWQATPLRMPGSETRLKMDNGWLGDLDGDGDMDVVTTEENGAWGVIWFENPRINKTKSDNRETSGSAPHTTGDTGS